MKTPVSWIREFVDLPADVTTEDLAARLTALGLKLEAIEKPGDEITGPLVIGRVLTMDAEPQKNGKTINWCTVDVGRRERHRRAPGHRLRRPQLRARRPRRVRAARRRAARELRDLRAQDLRPRLGRDDLLVQASSASARTTTASSCCPPTPASPATTRSTVLGLREEVIEFEINPDRAYALSLRGVAREAALAYDAPYRDPADRKVPEPNDDGYPIVIDDPAGCPVFAARVVSGFDPTAPTPDWLAHRVRLAGMRPISLAVDVTNYVMLELGQPIHGYDADKLAGPIRVRRATEGEQLTTLDGVKRTMSRAGPGRHRRLRPDRPRRRHGRRDHRDVRDHHPRADRGGALGRGLDVPHRQAAPAHAPRPASATSAASTRCSRPAPPTGSPSC